MADDFTPMLIVLRTSKLTNCVDEMIEQALAVQKRDKTAV